MEGDEAQKEEEEEEKGGTGRRGGTGIGGNHEILRMMYFPSMMTGDGMKYFQRPLNFDRGGNNDMMTAIRKMQHNDMLTTTVDSFAIAHVVLLLVVPS